LDLKERSGVNRKHVYSGSRESPVYELTKEWEENPFRFTYFGNEW